MAAILQTIFLKAFFFNVNAWIVIETSLKFVAKAPISNIPALAR